MLVGEELNPLSLRILKNRIRCRIYGYAGSPDHLEFTEQDSEKTI